MTATLLIWIWFGLALIVSASGALVHTPVPPPAVAGLLTGMALLALVLSPALNAQLRRLGPAPLVSFHLVRVVVGVYFLILYQRDELPGAFAIAAGWGDIVVGLAAGVVLWLCIPVRALSQRWGLLAWNTIGLVDILLVLANGVRLFVADPGLAEPFTRFPLALLPTFVVPVVITSHIVLFTWFGRAEPAARLE